MNRYATLRHPGLDQATRALVAAIAGRAITRASGNHIYDHGLGAHRCIGGQVEYPTVRVYDFDRGCHITGTLPSLYDFGRSAHLRLNLEGDGFRGYDFASSAHFNGRVSGKRVTLYDFGSSSYHHFTL